MAVYCVVAPALFLRSFSVEALRCLWEGVQRLRDPGSKVRMVSKSGITQAVAAGDRDRRRHQNIDTESDTARLHTLRPDRATFDSMKKILATALLLMVFASPAFAAVRHHHHRHHHHPQHHS
jgi:predicted S18 family serine protease